MPEIAEPPVAAPAPSPSPAQAAPAAPSTGTPVSESPTGSQAFVQEMEAMISPPPSPTPPVAAPKPTPTPEPQKATPPPTPPPTKIEPVKEKDPVSLRKRLAEIEAKYSQLEQTAANERRQNSEKIAEFEKRKYLTKEQEEDFARTQNRAKELEAELYARDYQQSPEFKSKYEQRWQQMYQNFVEELNGMPVTDEEGNARTATATDFNAVLSAPKGQQWNVAKKLFGENAQLVIGHRNTLKMIEAEAGEELRKHRETYEQQKRTRDSALQQLGSHFQRIHSEVDSAIQQKYPEYFGDDPANPEANEAMKKGLDFVDSSLKVADNIPIEDRAMRAALIRRWAGAFPRLVLQTRKLQAELEAANSTIAKLQGTDPGAGGEGGGTVPVAKKDGGVDELVKEFDNLTP